MTTPSNRSNRTWLKILTPLAATAAVGIAAGFSLSASGKLADAQRLANEAEQKQYEQTAVRDLNEWRPFGVLLEERSGGQWVRRSESDLALNYEVIRSNTEGARAPDLKISLVQREGAIRGVDDRIVSMRCGFHNVSTKLTSLNRKEAVGQVINIKCANTDWRMTLTADSRA